MTGKELNIDMESQPFTKEGFLRLRQTLRTLVIGVLVLAAIALAFGILTIYLVVLAKNNHNEIEDIKEQFGYSEKGVKAEHVRKQRIWSESLGYCHIYSEDHNKNMAC